MRQFLRMLLGFVALVALGAPQASASPDTKAYGILAFSAEQPGLSNNIVTFDLVSEAEPVFASAVPFSETATAGAYGDRHYYVAVTEVSGGKEVPKSLVKIDLTTSTKTTVGNLTGYANLINDMTYDWSTSTMYAISRVDNTKSALYVIDLATAASRKVADLDRRFFTLAASYAGQLYGISFAGEFCTIDKATGAVAVVGSTGQNPEKFQTMEFDHATGTLYWLASTRVLNEGGTIEVPESFVATINPATGAITRHQNFGDNQVAGLYVPGVIAPANCPAAVTALKVVGAAEGKAEAILSWTNPSKTFGGETLKTISYVEVSRDGKVVGKVSNATPGAAASYTDVIGGENGAQHTWQVVAYNTNGAGAPVSVAAFIGRDVPAAVQDLAVEKLTPASAKITWKPVTTGKNGGWTDAATMVYDVVREPGAVEVAKDLTACEWTEQAMEVSGTYTYTVTARNSCGTSDPVTTQPVILGPKLGVPYACEFEDDFGQWTAIDANNDGNTWTKFTLSWAKATGAYFNTAQYPNYYDGDDWLISNLFELEPSSTYKVKMRYLAQGLHGVKVCLLADADTQNPLQVIDSLALPRAYNPADFEFTFTTAANVGDCNFALYEATPQRNSYLLIDRIEIEKVVERNLAATGISGIAKPIAGRAYDYIVTVDNKGSFAYSEYTVDLLDAQGNVVATKNVTDTIKPNATAEVTLSYEFPLTGGITAVRGRVTAQGDMFEGDNLTQLFEFELQPAGSPEEITFGTKTGNANYAPMNLYNKYGASLNIYKASEIPIKRGRISSVKWDYAVGSYSTAPQNVEIKVFLANTDREKTNDGWIADADMTLVYEGTINLENGTHTLDLPFSKAFEYDGRNLALKVISSLANSNVSYSYVGQPYYTTKDGDNGIYAGSYDPLTGSESIRTIYGRSLVTFMAQSGGACISGTVTDTKQQPVADAIVTVKEINAETKTNADGTYRFDFVPNGTYTVAATRFGYKDSEAKSVKIDEADASADFAIEKLATYNVSGKVAYPDGKAMTGAAVKLYGYTTLSATTAADGAFAFADVVICDSNIITVQKEWFVTDTLAFALKADTAFSAIKLDYAHFAPVNVVAEEEGGSLSLRWATPADTAEIAYDSGVAATQIGYSDRFGSLVAGSVFRQPMTLTSAKWYTTYEGGPHTTVSLYVYDLDAEGNPTGTILYSENRVPNTDGQWTEHVLAQPVEAPNGCFIALNYPGFLGIGVDGASKTHPMRKNTYAFSVDYASGDFDYIEDEALTGNLMIRACGLLHSAEGEAQAQSALPDFYRYNVWRSEGFGSNEWTKANEAPLSAQHAVYLTWGNLPAGVYRYAVTSVFPDGSESEKTVGCYVPNKMLGKLSLKAKTNSHSGNPEGAVVKIDGADPADSRSAIADSTGVVTFDGIWRDAYALNIALPGYEFDTDTVDMMASANVNIDEALLREIIATPVNAEVTGDLTNGFRFTWNESGEIADDFEDHDPFTVASPGEIGWQYRDADGSRTFAEQDFDFPGRTQPCSFMTFNPWETSPSMADERSASLPHSGKMELACFAGFNGSDDWFISPRLTYHTPFTFTFYARGYSQTYGEVMRIGYSTTDTKASSFTWVTDSIDVPMQVWTKFEYNMPAEARYVAINAISPDGFTLFVDDVAISSGRGFDANTAVSGPEVKYVVSLDGKEVAQVDTCAYTFANVAEGDHQASVKAVYASGESQLCTVPFGTSGIADADADKISVWPNPAPGYTMVRGDFERAVLYDLSGRLVDAFAGNEQRLDLGHVAPGLYILLVEPAQGTPVSVKLTVR